MAFVVLRLPCRLKGACKCSGQSHAALGVRRPTASLRRVSAFSEGLVLVAKERREEIADDPTRAGLDLDRDGHAGREIDCLVFDLHLSVVERHAGGVDQFLAFRLAAPCFHALRLLDYSFLWLVAG